MLFLSLRGSMQSSNAMWPTAHMLPMCGGPTTTSSWLLSVGVTRVSWSGPMSPRATGNSNSVTVRSRTLRARMTAVRDELPFEVCIHQIFSVAEDKICVIPVSHQVMTVMWRGRTRSTTPSRPYPPTCDPWRVWSPTCSWKSPLWMKGEAMMLQMLRRTLLSSQKITFRNFCLSLYKKNKASASKIKPILQSTFSFPATALPPPFWNNSAFSALLLSLNGCPSVIILLRSLILLEDKGWSGKLLCSCTVCWFWTKDQAVVVVEICLMTEGKIERM